MGIGRALGGLGPAGRESEHRNRPLPPHQDDWSLSNVNSWGRYEVFLGGLWIMVLILSSAFKVVCIQYNLVSDSFTKKVKDS